MPYPSLLHPEPLSLWLSTADHPVWLSCHLADHQCLPSCWASLSLDIGYPLTVTPVTPAVAACCWSGSCVALEQLSESESEVAQSCLTLCDPMDCSLPSSSVHGILQAKVLEWVAVSFSRGSSQPRDQTQVSHTAGRHFTVWATRETLSRFK